MGWRRGVPRGAAALRRVAVRATRLGLLVAGGCMGHRELASMRERRWRDFYAGPSDVDAGFLEWEERLIPRFLADGARVLVVGSGSGRDLLALARRRHHVEGIEAVARASALARRALAERGLDVAIHEGDVVTMALPAGPYDAVVFSWFCYTYLAERARRVGMLRRLRAVLAPDARVLISYLPARDRRWGGMRLVRMVARLTRSDWSPERGDILYDDAAPGTLHFEHHFQTDEIEGEARDAGFDVAFHEHGEIGFVALTLSRAVAPARTP